MAVAKEKNFSRAAEKIFVSQPNLSRSISKLEEELEVLLFDRSNKIVELTEAGKLYYELFQRIQFELKETRIRAKQLNHNRQGNIRLGYLEGWKLSSFLPAVLQKFKEEYPGILIKIEGYSYAELLYKLSNDELDVILTIDGMLDQYDHLRKQEITHIQKGILYSDGHPGFAHVTSPNDFKNVPFFVMDEDGTFVLGNEIRKYCEPYGFVPQLQYVKNMESVLANVENGLGVMFCDEWTRYTTEQGFGFFPINEQHTIALCWKATTSNVAVSVFVNEVSYILTKALYQK